jgi:aminopeptidase-like protein
MSTQTTPTMHDLITELYPIPRSITGDGFRTTLRRIQQIIPLELHEVPSGTPVFDWTVPKEWNIRDGWVKNPQGEKIIDFQQQNLHVLNYSVPVHQKLTLAELRPHLFSTPDYPDAIPYRTSYYKETWGFCLPHHQLLALEDGEYEVMIDSTLADGSLTYGEYVLPGETGDEVLISCHACHPSLANDNLSGIAVATHLALALKGQPTRRYTYRLIFIPGTIGSITWLALNEAVTPNIKHGLVLTCVGDPGHVTYKKSRRATAEIDRAVQQILHDSGAQHTVIDFFPYGYDERQYCSPGFNLPVGVFMRSQHGQFPEYHTSADNLDFVQEEFLQDSLGKLLQVVDVLETNQTYTSTNPKCEPQLGKRGLYGAIGGQSDKVIDQMAILWVLNLADGEHDLLDMAARSGMRYELIRNAAEVLAEHGLLVVSD